MKTWVSRNTKAIRWKTIEKTYYGIIPGWYCLKQIRSISTSLNLRQSDIICHLIWCNKYRAPIMKDSCGGVGGWGKKPELNQTFRSNYQFTQYSCQKENKISMNQTKPLALSISLHDKVMNKLNNTLRKQSTKSKL